MFTTPITYTDWNGDSRTEKFSFNISQHEAVSMQWSKNGGLDKYLADIVKAGDKATLISLFEDLIKLSYGEISEDGRRFVKENGKRAEAFMETPAYDVLYRKLTEDSAYASQFVNGILNGIKIPNTDKPTIQKVEALNASSDNT